MILHPHFTGYMAPNVMRRLIESGFDSIGPLVHHLVVPSRGRPELDAKLGNLLNLQRFVESRATLIHLARPGSIIQINFEPNKGGENPAGRQYRDGHASLEWAACAAQLISAVRNASSLDPLVGVCLYASLRAPKETDHVSVNRQLLPLFNEMDLVTSARYCRGPEFNPREDIVRLAESAAQVGVKDRWALQVWSVLQSDQNTPISYQQAIGYAEAFVEADVQQVIAYVEAATDAQAAAEAEGWLRIGQAMKDVKGA